MSDRRGMMLAIHQQPADDLPRLAYADWLEEHGDAEHAEFVRVELRLARLPRDHAEYRALFAREVELILRHKDEWFGTWRRDWNGYEMRRGFIEEVNARTPAAVLPCADWLLSHHALQDLRVNGPWPELRPLLDHPLSGVLARLSLVGPDGANWSGWYDAGRFPRDAPLAERPLLLALTGHRAGPDLVEALLAAPCLRRVSRLSLSGNALGAAGLNRLLDGLRAMPSLKALLLAGRTVETTPRRHVAVANVGPDGILALADHPSTARLEEIDLTFNALDGDGVRALVDSPYLGAIRRLVPGTVPRRADRARLRKRFGTAVEMPREE